ncbi:MAG: phosphotransferase [Candidatus Saccharimonadales bacterium]
MEILGHGHDGIVVADTPDTVQKFYVSETEATKEQTSLAFLEEMQGQDFNIGCTIPKLLEVLGRGEWVIDGKAYTYSNRMERVPGTCARLAITSFTEQQIEALGQALGTIGFTMHSQSQAHIDTYKARFGADDSLLTDIVKVQAAQVLHEESDQGVAKRVKIAADHLQKQCRLFAAKNTLSHLDFTLSNTQIDDKARVTGIVDWGGFGLTHPSLSLYQLAIYPVWPHVKRQYERQGVMIREDIVYAAGAIHVAWTPLICKQLGLSLAAEGPLEHFDVMYDRFEAQL